VLIVLLLVLVAGVASAGEAAFVSYVDSAEKRLADGNVTSARSYVKSARKDLDRMSDAERDDPDVRRATKRLDELEDELEKAEASSGKAKEADVLIRDARGKHLLSGSAKSETDQKRLEECVAMVDQAIGLDPQAAERGGSELREKCAKSLAQTKAWLSGEGRRPPDEDEGAPKLKQGYADAKAAVADKKAEAEVVVKGQRGAETCLRVLSSLESTVENSGSRNKKYYDVNKATITTSDGSLTLAKARETCTSMMKVLAERKVLGCGSKGVSATQDYLGGGRWSRSRYSASEKFAVIACNEMPKRDVFPGSSSAHRGSLKSMCAGGVVVVDDTGWLKGIASDGSAFRAIGGTCYAKGKLQFK
jgi:hypothetical protein